MKGNFDSQFTVHYVSAKHAHAASEKYVPAGQSSYDIALLTSTIKEDVASSPDVGIQSSPRPCSKTFISLSSGMQAS